MIAIVAGHRIRPAAIEQHARHRHRQREIAARPRLHERVAQERRLVPDRIDQHLPRPRFLQHGDGMRRRDEDVLSPEQDVPRIQQIENVVRILLAEIDQLRLVPRAGTDVAALRRHRPEFGKEVIRQVLQRAERAAAAIVKDRSRACGSADPQQLGGGEVERLVPRDRIAAQQRRGQPLGRVLQRQEIVRAPAEKTVGHRMRRIAAELHYAPVLDVRDDRARVRTVAVADGLPDLAHRPRILLGGRTDCRPARSALP